MKRPSLAAERCTDVGDSGEHLMKESGTRYRMRRTYDKDPTLSDLNLLTRVASYTGNREEQACIEVRIAEMHVRDAVSPASIW